MLDMELSEQDKHSLNLGRLVGNLQSLEFALRAFLVNSEIASGASFPQSASLDKMNEGEIVPKNAFTNYDSLEKIIKKYNRDPKILAAGLTIDKSLVAVRDAIAHGRVSAPAPSASLRLLKFGKPENNQVKVVFSVTMTREWLAEQIKRAYEAVLKVSEANERLRSGRL